MSGHEAGPRSLERLNLVRVDSAGYTDEGSLEVTVTYRYDEWCCNGFHEVADAVQSIHQMMDKSQERAYKKRIKKINDEYKSLREEMVI